MTNRQFEGRLFGPGLPDSGVSATAHWTKGGGLRVAVTGAEGASFLAVNPAIAAAGFNSASLRISWQAADGNRAFIIETTDNRNACTTSAPTAIAGRIAAATGARNSLEKRFRFGGVLLALILALPLLGIALFLTNSDRVADWAVTRITPQQEARFGELVLAQTRLQMKILDRGPAVDAISAIGSKLTAGSPHNYRWFVSERSDVNAFAVPGGMVVVFSGLLNSAGSPEELAGVLAHEVAHAELRHSLRGMIKSLGLRALVSLLTGDASGSVFVDAATRLTELRFSREAEREADDEGLRRLIGARIDPNGMLRFYEKLAADQRLSPPSILSTHPASGERLERLRLKVAGLKEKWVPLPVDLVGAVKRHEAEVRP